MKLPPVRGTCTNTSSDATSIPADANRRSRDGAPRVACSPLNRFWPQVIRPLLEAARPGVVVEVGAGAGAHTRRLAKFCRSQAITLHVLDPAPRFDPSAL